MGCSLLFGLPQIAGAVSDEQQEYLQAMQSKLDPSRGQELFHTCQACHGPSGGGVSDGSVPRIAGQHFSVLVRQIVDFRHNKRWDPRMVHFADARHLANAQAIADVAGYVSQLEPRLQSEVQLGPGQDVERGRDVYANSCAGCHGAAGEGDGRHEVPQLAGQHYAYLLRQMDDAIANRRPSFSAEHIRLLTHLGRDNVAAIADFLARAPRQTPPLYAPGTPR